MLLNKEYAKSRILLDQSQSEKKDGFSSQYFKTREEPQMIKPVKIQNDLELGMEEETSNKVN